MAKFTIDWSEQKTTKNGKLKLDATLTSAEGVKIENVTIWGDFPNFDKLMTGNDVEGTIQEKQNGNYLNRTLYPIQAANTSKPARTEMTNKAIERKEKTIEKAMDRKEDSFKTSGTFRDATILTAEMLSQMTARGEGWNFDTAKEIWTNWRVWLTDNFEIQDQPPFIK